jgi:hypothetical protein
MMAAPMNTRRVTCTSAVVVDRRADRRESFLLSQRYSVRGHLLSVAEKAAPPPNVYRVDGFVSESTLRDLMN